MPVLALVHTLCRQRSPLLTQHCLTATPSEKLEKTPTQGPALCFPELSEMPIGYQRDTTPAPSRMLPRLPKCIWTGASLQTLGASLRSLPRRTSFFSPPAEWPGAGEGGDTEPGPRRAAAGGVGRHLRAGPATAAPGAGDGERGWKAAGEGKGREGFGWKREPGDAVTAWGADGEVGAGLCHRLVIAERRNGLREAAVSLLGTSERGQDSVCSSQELLLPSLLHSPGWHWGKAAFQTPGRIGVASPVIYQSVCDC